MKKLISYVAGVSLVFLCAASTQANQFCFAAAKTYYEQVYCELEAKGKTKGLPSFDQFKRNNEVVQASLLKLPAERNRIILPSPKKIDIPLVEKPVETPVGKSVTAKNESAEKNDMAQQVVGGQAVIERKPSKLLTQDSQGDCQLRATEIQCANKHYRLIGNKMNSRLAEGVLLDANKMSLPWIEPGESLNVYVTSAYRQYIEKMCAIGLGAATMTYARFAYLYEDLQSKNVNFVHRFELMYGYLKKDKASMWVSEKIPVNAQLALHYCELITENLYVCAAQGQNYIFELQN